MTKHFKSMIVTALMASASVLLTRFLSLRISIGGIEGIRLGFGSMPNIILGMVLGPAYGAIAGALSDVIGFILSPMGGYMPHFTVTAALSGAIPGLVFRALTPREERQYASTWKLVVSLFSGAALVSWLLTPYFLHTIFGLDLRIILPPRVAASFVEVPTYTLVLKALYPSCVKLALRSLEAR
ncbi:MAG: folate family ECF transporter S component [Candidatus Fermentithermobacillus carboniphilus]|uniref:Folate family ECF transporter S component n=1 Tax=Candidatus Fermentithermobacillus carboniphilus TaxID=3085328 RepID=A0AAT9LBY5_9FIRM|nr:MAG: folate family ECF transporter S component [Candidatus Fermentithermobacillus carboniphilus]